jgi:hypothetical protein
VQRLVYNELQDGNKGVVERWTLVEGKREESRKSFSRLFVKRLSHPFKSVTAARISSTRDISDTSSVTLRKATAKYNPPCSLHKRNAIWRE